MKRMLGGALAVLLTLGISATPAAADTTVMPEPPGNAVGACLSSDGNWTFPLDQLFPPLLAIDKCRNAGGSWFTLAQYNAIRNGRGVFFAPTDGSHGRAAATAAGLPANWYAKPAECAWLPSTRSTTGDNLLMDVHIAEGAELLLEGLYNSGSNEPTGIAGIFLGIALTGAKAIRYEIEWRYELQAECKDTLTARQIDGISSSLAGLSDLGGIAASSATAATQATNNGTKIDDLDSRLDQTNIRLDSQLDINVGSRASQASIDDVKAISESILDQASRTLGEVEGRIDTSVGSRASQASADAILADVDAILSQVTSQLDVNVGSRASQTSLDNMATSLDSRINDVGDKTADLRGEVEALRVELDAAAQQSVDFLIEDKLQSCTVLAVFLIDGGPGLQSKTFDFVESLIQAFGARAPAKAASHYAQAVQQRGAADPAGAFNSLCKAYKELVKS